MTPDHQALVADIEGVEFKLGAIRGKWRLETLKFPFAFVAIRAPKRDQGPARFLLRIDCTNYPTLAPTSQLWDGRTDTALRLEERPMGKAGVLVAFSGWNACLYHPIDRVAREHWPNQFSELAWKKGSNIVTLLEIVHDLLNDPEYMVATAPNAAATLRSRVVEASPA
jgi:hypothetical protein